ncbi:hypothetical protein [Plantactinospora sonchi]|uniref:Helix-hairpin-helix domain-containing protein n=1 Tax=Plantactinospora sonchi TaxID=1544735 RepID=A0ABU7RYS1_9ACTN
MTTLAQLRKTALSYPETVERGGLPGVAAFAVGDTEFASVDAEHRVCLQLPKADADQVLAEHPTAERLTRGATAIGVRVPLRDINGQQLNHWVRRAWLAYAPEPLAARVAAAETAIPGQVGDLPRAIGGPATRALAGAGITSLAQVAELTGAELAALHGVGPKAVRILREALGATGRTLRD